MSEQQPPPNCKYEFDRGKKIGEAFANATMSGKNFISGVGNNIQNMASGIGNGIQGITSGVGNGIQGMSSGIGNGIQGMRSGIGNAMQSMASSMQFSPASSSTVPQLPSSTDTPNISDPDSSNKLQATPHHLYYVPVAILLMILGACLILTINVNVETSDSTNITQIIVSSVAIIIIIIFLIWSTHK